MNGEERGELFFVFPELRVLLRDATLGEKEGKKKRNPLIAGEEEK